MDTLIFPKREPPFSPDTDIARHAKKIGINVESDEHISWRVEKEHYYRFNSVSKSEREEILNCFKKGGITVGEVAKKFGVDSRVVGDIIYLNITQINMLRSESL